MGGAAATLPIILKIRTVRVIIVSPARARVPRFLNIVVRLYWNLSWGIREK